MSKMIALLLIAATALLGACNKTGGDNSSTASGANKAASASK